MPIAPAIFKVATEFRFEIASALLNSKKLQTGLEGISNSVNQVEANLAGLSLNLASSLGLFPSSIVGIVGAGLKSSEGFYQTQLAFANLISSNKEHLSGTVDTYSDRLLVAKQIISDIVAKGNEFGLPEKDLISFTKNTAAMLIQTGQVGRNFSTAIELSRNLLKSAPNLGIEPWQVQGQMMDMISGNASRGGRLWDRLTAETEEFGQFKKSGTKGFNLLTPKKRIDLLRGAFQKFASDTKILEARLNSLTGQMQKLRNIVMGVEGILKPIGDAVKVPILKMLKVINNVLEKEGKKTFSNIGELLGSFISDPKKLFTNIMQIKNLGADVQRTGNIVSIGAGALILGQALKFLKVTAKLAHPAIGAVAMSLGVLYDVMQRLPVGFGGLSTTLLATVGILGAGVVGILKFKEATAALGFIFKRIFLPATLLIGLMQILTRAQSKAKLLDLERIPGGIAEISNKMVRFNTALNNIMSPVTAATEAISDFLAPFFTSYWIFDTTSKKFEFLTSIMESVGDGVLALQGVFSGVIFSFMHLGEMLAIRFDELGKGNILQAFDMDYIKSKTTFGSFEDAYLAGFDDFLEDHFARMAAGDTKFVSQQHTNIAGGIHINNQFKEQMEPDRIAFTLKDQLLRAAQNPTQARNKSLATIGIGN